MDENNKLPFDLFGIECNSGWEKLYKPIFEYIWKYNDENPDNQIEVLQVKEKWGGLEFYVSHHDKILEEMIREARRKSYHVCEDCGSETEIGQTQGYIITLCKDCAEKLAIKNNHPVKWTSNSETIIFYPDGHRETKTNQTS